MTMNSGNSRGMSSEINVTPMIDVLLVLLIIFMLIVPLIPRGEAASAPQPPDRNRSHENAVVLELTSGSGGEAGYRINRQAVAREDLQAKVAEIFANRARREMFVKADGRLTFTEVAEAIDTVRSAGVDRVGLLTPAVEAGR
jgi:biopolymer transport protein ExbD/biopolymer transport protein TolR